MSDEVTILAELKERAMRLARPGNEMETVYLAIGTLYVLDLLKEARDGRVLGSEELGQLAQGQ